MAFVLACLCAEEVSPTTKTEGASKRTTKTRECRLLSLSLFNKAFYPTPPTSESAFFRIGFAQCPPLQSSPQSVLSLPCPLISSLFSHPLPLQTSTLLSSSLSLPPLLPLPHYLLPNSATHYGILCPGNTRLQQSLLRSSFCKHMLVLAC